MAKNSILRFAMEAGTARILSDEDYSTDPDRTTGHGSGVARSALFNKIERGTSAMAAMLGQFVAGRQSQDISDDLDTDDLEAYLENAISAVASNVVNAKFEAAYPVGTPYINVSKNVDPNDFLPGLWAREQRGFLYPYGAPSSGSVGHQSGEVNHRLTISETARHAHFEFVSADQSNSLPSGSTRAPSTGKNDTGNRDYRIGSIDATPNAGLTSYSGGGGSHNNMPPFVTVYMWRRVS